MHACMHVCMQRCPNETRENERDKEKMTETATRLGGGCHEGELETPFHMMPLEIDVASSFYPNVKGDEQWMSRGMNPTMIIMMPLTDLH